MFFFFTDDAKLRLEGAVRYVPECRDLSASKFTTSTTYSGGSSNQHADLTNFQNLISHSKSFCRMLHYLMSFLIIACFFLFSLYQCQVTSTKT